MNLIKSFLSNDEGLETIEYAILIGFIVGALILIIAAIGTWVKGQYSGLKTEMGA